jgi:hypothetical protein
MRKMTHICDDLEHLLEPRRVGSVEGWVGDWQDRVREIDRTAKSLDFLWRVYVSMRDATRSE